MHFIKLLVDTQWPDYMDPVVLPLYKKALANQIAIAVGSSCSDPQFSIPHLGDAINRAFDIGFEVEHPLDFFGRWNDLVDAAEKIAGRPKLSEFVATRTKEAQPTLIQQRLAAVPISNFGAGRQTSVGEGDVLRRIADVRHERKRLIWEALPDRVGMGEGNVESRVMDDDRGARGRFERQIGLAGTGSVSG